MSLSLLTAVVLLALERIQDSEVSRPAIDWLRVIVGVALLDRGRLEMADVSSRQGANAELPAWMSRLDELSVRGAARDGSVARWVNPKNVVLTLAAGSSIAELVDDGVSEVAAASLFVALSSITVVGATALQLFPWASEPVLRSRWSATLWFVTPLRSRWSSSWSWAG